METLRNLLVSTLFLAFCLVSVSQVARISASPAMSLPKDAAKARVKYKPQPQYPDEAREKKIKATVILRAIFRSSGEVTDITLARVVPDNLPENLAKLFVDRSIEAAREIKFQPAVKNGKPVSMYIQLEYNFRP
jgi:TonB family protein